jgi:hypothetical protein
MLALLRLSSIRVHGGRMGAVGEPPSSDTPFLGTVRYRIEF